MLADRKGKKAKCKICGRESEEISFVLGVCLSCIRSEEKALQIAIEAHKKIRMDFNLPPEPPSDANGIQCKICANECKMGEGEKGYCSLRRNINGKIKIKEGLLHTYYDPLPTNCCASCQNWEHKNLDMAAHMEINELVRQAEKANCICYFGGTPEPQLPFLLRATKKILERKKLRICWEWNGTGNPKLVKKAAEFSYATNGIIKFDLKAFDCNLNIALTGRPNYGTLKNFEMIAKEFNNILTATTLLIPGYIDKEEVEKIAKFKKLAEECYEVAIKHLNRVNIGNKHLLW